MSDIRAEKERIFGEVLDALEVKYPSGLYDWLYVHDRALYAQINKIEDALSKSFAEGGSVDEFKGLLRLYWDVHIDGIRKFRIRRQTPFNFAEVREARIQEREAACA